ncbi:MAG TPA: SurA N-terminal domain-containing protein [Rhizomicrobium sp.]|nr:SurA N-terminal domain-containing protein [Rhizomicrobium sp.]
MLQQMRSLPKWVGFLLLLPLSATFVVWGIADIFRGSVDTSIATVGGTKIDSQDFSRDFQNARNAATRRGTQLSAARAKEIGDKLLEQAIDDTALDNAARSFDLLTSNDEVSSTIRSIQGFQGPDGNFSDLAFNQALQRINYTPQGFVAEVKRELTREQLVRAGASAAELPMGYVRAIVSYLSERRAVQYMILPPDAAGPISPPPDQVLAAYIKAHANRFSTPEYRQLTYAELGPDDLQSQVQVTDAQIKQTYDLRKDTYIVPDRRDIQRIDFKDEASAKAARAKIDAGTSFEDIATQQHMMLTALNLGSLTQADLGPVQGPAAFALPLDGISQPVKSAFGSGWSLLRVTKITPGKTTTLDEARPALKAELFQQLAASHLEDVINAYDDAHNAGADMAEAAKKVGMHVVHVATTDAHGMAQDGSKADVPTTPDFLDQVFKSDIGTEDDPFRSTDGRYYIIKVDGVIPQKLKPLDAVRAQALAVWTEDQRVQRLAAKAEAIAKEANAGGNLAQIAAQYHGILLSSPALMRDQPTAVMSADFLAKVFSVPGGQTVSGTAADGKSYMVARVTGVFHPPIVAGDPQLIAFAQGLGRQISADIQAGMGKAARAAQGVTINQSQVDRVVGGEGS